MLQFCCTTFDIATQDAVGLALADSELPFTFRINASIL